MTLSTIQNSTVSISTGTVSTVSTGTTINASTYQSMLTVIESMLQHTHAVTDTYWSNCECECGGGGTT
jgi:hypothetical protein